MVRLNFRRLKEKLNDKSEKLLMYFPIPRTGSISMSYLINDSDSIFTYRNYELESCFYQQYKTIPPVPQTSTDKNDWDLVYFLSEDQSFFISQLSEIKNGFCKNIFNHEKKKVFTVVRNPIDRLFSIWNYCTNSTQEYELFSLNQDEEKYKIKDFNEFVKEFATNGLPEKYPSKMFLTMSDILDIELGEKLLIYKFENMQKCTEFLRSEYSVQNEHKHYNSSKKIPKNISDSTLEFIYQLYKEDFIRFNY